MTTQLANNHLKAVAVRRPNIPKSQHRIAPRPRRKTKPATLTRCTKKVKNCYSRSEKAKKSTTKPKATVKPVAGFGAHINDYKDESFYLEYKDEKSTDNIGYSVIRNVNDIEDISLALPDDVKLQSGTE